MDPEHFFAAARDLLRGHPLLAAVLAVAVLLYAWRRTWEFFKLALLLLVLASVLYFLFQLRGTVSTGASQKEQVIHKTRQAAGE